MARVYAWPPIGVIAQGWTEEAQINTSIAWPSGARLASSAGPVRRVVSLSVSALARGRHGAGYMEVLKRHLAGGQHYVRIRSLPINDIPAYDDESRQSLPLEWQQNNGPAALNWSGLTWISGRALPGVRQSPDFTLRVEGLPPSVVIAWPGEFVTVYRASDGAESTVMIERVARTNINGVALIRTVTNPAWNGRVSIGTSETAVFAATSIPRAVRPVSGDWTYDWSFREVFADEVSGGFEEIDPW